MTRLLLVAAVAIVAVLAAAGVVSGTGAEVNVTFAGHFGGVTCAVAVAGDYTYIGQGQDLVVLDISNPASPTELGRLSTAGFVRDVAVSGSYAYVADDTNGLVIVNVDNKATPTLAGSYDTAGGVHGVAVSGNYAYVAEYGNGLVIVDISDPATPTHAGSYDTAGAAYAVAVSGNYSYVADGRNGLVILRTDVPVTPQRGDLNSDGILPADAAIALRLAATGGWDANADVNHDSRITSLDALMILQAAAGRIEL